MAGELPTDTDVEYFLDDIEDPGRRADCRRLIEIMADITGKSADAEKAQADSEGAR